MNVRELIEKWEREADTAEHVLQRTGGSPGGQQRVEDQIEKNREHAAELRAALPEQPLSRKWREDARERREAAKEAIGMYKENLERHAQHLEEIRTCGWREICRSCCQPSPVGFHVPDHIWKAAVPDASYDLRNRPLCIMCFARFADEAGIEWDRDIAFYPVSLVNHQDKAHRNPKRRKA